MFYHRWICPLAQNLHFIYVFLSWLFGSDICICEQSFTMAMTSMDNGFKFKVTGPYYDSTNSPFLVLSIVFPSNHEVITPILTELCVHTIGNYIYGTDIPFSGEKYQYVHRKFKYSKGRCLYYCNSCTSRCILLLSGDISTNPGPNNFENRGSKTRNLSSLINIQCTPSHII